MANIGRFFCVALPFILTLLSIITLLVACLGGVTSKDLYMFQVNTTDLTINPASIKSIINRRQLLEDAKGVANDIIDGAKDTANDVLNSDAANTANDIINGGDSSNITAADLGLADGYEINLWGYCMTDLSKDEKECTKPRFNWASETLNTTLIEKLKGPDGKKIDIPEEVEAGLNAFTTVTKWTEVAYIAALVALGVQLFFGFFAQCSRGFSCVVFLVALVAAILVMAAAGLSTAMSVVVVGTVESTAKFYGVSASFHTSFLALVWTSAAFALASAFFWLFTICCCAPDHRSKRSNLGSTDQEKLLPTGGSYQPLHDPHMHGGNNPSYYNTSYGAPKYNSGGPRSDLAYEPFSHR